MSDKTRGDLRGSLMDMDTTPLDPRTAVVALGRPDRREGAPLNPPIAMSSTFIGIGGVTPTNPVYARFTQESWEPLEEAVGTLEGSSLPALAYASGMAGVSAVFDLLPAGGTLVMPGASYNGSIGLARELAAENKIVLREIDPVNIEATVAALEGADLVWVESPTNPLLEVVDLPLLIEAAHDRGVMVAVDNTFSTPLRQQPLRLGADLVIHSGTKFIAGHSDLLIGLVVTDDEGIRERLRGRRTLRGSVPGSFEAWLALRGLRTLALRLDRAEESAGILAQRLLTAPGIARVRYPGLESDPHHERATRQLQGYGAIISVELAGGKEHADAFVDALTLIAPATSLGGVESLAERRRRHPSEPVQVPESLVRISVGIEYVEDLWADLSRALEEAATFASPPR